MDNAAGRNQEHIGIEGTVEGIHYSPVNGKGQGRRPERHAPAAGRKIALHQGGDIHALHPGEGLETLFPRPSLRLGENFQCFGQKFLPFADAEEIHERRHRFGGKGTRPPGGHEGMVFSPVSRQERDAAEVEHSENVGIAQFVLEGEPHHVEPVQGTAALHGSQGHSFFPEQPLEIRPWTVGPFRVGPGQSLHQKIEDLKAQVAHPYFVDVRKGKAYTDHPPGILLRGQGAEFASGIPGRPLHIRKKRPHSIGIFRKMHTAPPRKIRRPRHRPRDVRSKIPERHGRTPPSPSGSFSLIGFQRGYIHALGKGQGNGKGEQGASAVAHQRQGESRDGKESHAHADALRHLEPDPGGNAGDEHFRPAVLGAHGRLDEPPEEYPKEKEHADGPDKAEFFAVDAENKVGVGFRQKPEFALQPLHEPFAQESSRSYGNPGLDHVVSRPQGIHPRIEKNPDPHFLVLLQELPSEGHRRHHQADEACRVFPRGAGNRHGHHGDCPVDHGASCVGLDEHKPA
ncbi:hypothetical protein SDC9_55352 [bioreactor metagenome]|uniref:Uncharacterized protein n=1 Tax=bioreactor metagenome TaxID=1076179 RepID=A0A644WYP7_9ZZZZ